MLIFVFSAYGKFQIALRAESQCTDSKREKREEKFAVGDKNKHDLEMYGSTGFNGSQPPISRCNFLYC
jgi:hypothetical protein